MSRVPSGTNSRRKKPSATLKESNMEQVEVVREMIRKHGIPRSTVARLSGLWLTDLSAWLNGRQDLAADRVARVMETVEDIAKVI